jgi:hypothetical protein
MKRLPLSKWKSIWPWLVIAAVAYVLAKQIVK